MGVVEISRGCGLGCDFCTIAREPMVHLPPDAIAEDLRTNLRAFRAIHGPDRPMPAALISEDFFRYGARRPTEANPGALIGLLERLRTLDGLGILQVDHANIASVAGFSDEQLRRVYELLTGGSPRADVWVNLGVETASPRLLASHGGAAKMHPWGLEGWTDACLEQVKRLVAAGFLPMVSLVMGIPGETRDDVERTRAWVERLRGERVLVFPLFHAPVEPGVHRFTTNDLSDAHWRLLAACYRFNFRWTPGLIWNNQSRAGVPLAKRLALQLLGRGNILFWKALFLWRSGGLVA